MAETISGGPFGLRPARFVVLLVLLVSGTLVEGQGRRCPAKCLCFRTTVRCMFLQLDAIPEVPRETTILDLRFNKIKSIPPNTFQDLSHLHTLLLNNNHIVRLQNGSFNGLSELRYLYLYKNRIRVIEKQVFQGLDKLEQLYLHFNDLATFEADTFSNIPSLERLFLHNNRLQRVPKGAFRNLHSLRRLRLDSNALVCDCQLMWLAQMVKEKQHRTQVAATCQFPVPLQGKSLTSLTDSEFQCRGTPLITEGPADIDVRFGGTAYFTCKVEGDPQPEVVWFHNNEVIDDKDRYSILTDGTLMIENTQGDDVGFYECMASNPAGEVRSRKAKMAPEDEADIVRDEEDPRIEISDEIDDVGELEPVFHAPEPETETRTLVDEPSVHFEEPAEVPIETAREEGPSKPRLLRLPSNVNVTEGSPVEIECEAIGTPKPHISWTKGGDFVVEGPRIQVSSRGTFSISSAERQDAGIYRCTAANHLGRVSAVATLRVLVRPTITMEPHDQYTSPGSSIVFSCQADGAPTPLISWYKDGQLLVPSGRLTISVGGISLGVQHVKGSDEGEYICRAHNSAGHVEATATLYVRDKVAPVIRKEPRDESAVSGQEVVKMPCKADGRPKPFIIWRKDGHILENGDKHRIEAEGSLYVYNITEDDAGIYECSAENHVGFDTARARLTVEAEPQTHIGDEFLQSSFSEAHEQVDRAVNDTISQLFQRDRNSSPNPHELLRIFRFPSGEGREIARAAEKIEQTLRIVKTHVESGMVFNLTSYNYQDLLSPEKLILLTNLSGCLSHRRTVHCYDMCFHNKYRTIDGTCNNLRNPLWGSSLTGFRRILPPIYENGFNTPIGWSKTKRYHGFFKPSARLVSTRIISTEEVSPDHHCTHMLMQWGQFLDHDLDHALPSISSESFHDGVSCQRSCDYAPPCFPIEIPPDDPRIRHHRCMEFTRSSGICGSGMTSVFFNTVLPREQINQLTSYLDGSQVYGSSAGEMRLLRNLTNNIGDLRTGILMSSGKPLMPFSDGAPVDCRRDLSESAIDCFVAGDIRANEQSGLTAMHTVWFREHNRVAQAMRELNPHWDGDTVFHEARKVVGAEMQHITYAHWLKHILGPQGMEMLGEYKGYDPSINPTISNVFGTAAYRFGHSLINPILHRLNATFQPIAEGHLPLHKAFFSPWRIVQEGGIDPLLRGLFATPAKLKIPGQFLNTELTEKLFRAAHEVALDLASLNIQRGRDHALPGYTEWRQVCNLSVPEDFDELAEDITSPEIREKLKQLYGHPGNVDVWVGGLLEDRLEGARVGPTFLCLLVEQFRKLRDGDRFWYENPSVFTTEQLAQIRQITLGRVLCDNGDEINDVTPDVFILPREQTPAFIPCSDVPIVDLRMWKECCADCRNSGNFHRLSDPGVRFRRQTDYTHVEDREHELMGIDGDEQIIFPEYSSPRTFKYNPRNSSVTSESSYQHSYSFEGLLSEDSSNESEDEEIIVDDFGTYEQDMTEQRIEGIEVLVEQLSKTVMELNKKVDTLEKMCGGHIRKKRICKDEDGRERRQREIWKKDLCTSCRCRRGKVRCRVLTCPRLTCINPVVPEGECCAKC